MGVKYIICTALVASVFYLCSNEITVPLFLGMFTKLWKVTISFVVPIHPSIWPHGTVRLPLNRFSWDLIFEYFFKIYWENSNSIKIWQEKRVCPMNTNIHFWSHFAQFFECEMFQTKLTTEKIKTHILCSITFIWK
jgi:hypothetical protein